MSLQFPRASTTLALKGDGTVWAWGNGSGGKLGDGTAIDRSTPVQVSGLTGATAIAAGSGHSLAVKSDGTAWAWGGNAYGSLGDGTTTARYTPVQVSGLTSATKVAAGANHSLAIKSDGTVWGWGANSYGKLGDGTTTNRYTPVQASGLTGVTAIAAGGDHSIALKGDGTVRSWGANFNGQLGDGTTTQRTTSVQVSGLSGIQRIAAGDNVSMAAQDPPTAISPQVVTATTPSRQFVPVSARAGRSLAIYAPETRSSTTRNAATDQGAPESTASERATQAASPVAPQATNMQAVVNVTEYYYYDANGARVKRVLADGSVRIYLHGGQYEETPGTSWVVRIVVTCQGRAVAQTETTAGGPALGVRLWLHGDHLGSVSVVTNGLGALVSRQEYTPWGEVRTGGTGNTGTAMQTSLDFTGQRRDSTGLLFYNARFYDPAIGRFVSADSIVPKPTNPQSLNRYSYVKNNPVGLTDPTGHEDIDGGGTGGGLPYVPRFADPDQDALYVVLAVAVGAEYAAVVVTIAALVGAVWLMQQCAMTDCLQVLVDTVAQGWGATVDLVNNMLHASQSGDIDVTDPDQFLGADFGTEKLREEHFRDHGAELGYNDIDDYVEGAERMLSEHDRDEISKVRERDGAIIKYNRRTGELVIGHKDGSIGTYIEAGAGGKNTIMSSDERRELRVNHVDLLGRAIPSGTRFGYYRSTCLTR